MSSNTLSRQPNGSWAGRRVGVSRTRPHSRTAGTTGPTQRLDKANTARQGSRRYRTTSKPS